LKIGDRKQCNSIGFNTRHHRAKVTTFANSVISANQAVCSPNFA
jgi:hypothetical protein